MESLGDRIRKLRGSRTQSKLAREIGTESLTVSRWELGRTEPSPENLAKLATHFGVAEAYLRYGTVVTSEPVHDEALSTLDQALAMLAKRRPGGVMEPDLEAHLRSHAEEVAFSTAEPLSTWFKELETEIRVYDGVQAARAPKVKQPPPVTVELPAEAPRVPGKKSKRG